jgi:hypothetical protein
MGLHQLGQCASVLPCHRSANMRVLDHVSESSRWVVYCVTVSFIGYHPYNFLLTDFLRSYINIIWKLQRRQYLYDEPPCSVSIYLLGHTKTPGMQEQAHHVSHHPIHGRIMPTRYRLRLHSAAADCGLDFHWRGENWPSQGSKRWANVWLLI